VVHVHNKNDEDKVLLFLQDASSRTLTGKLMQHFKNIPPC